MTQSMTLYFARDQILNQNRPMGWQKKARLVKAARIAAGWHAKAKLTSVSVRQHVTITYGWTGPNRVRDAGNLQPHSKACVDGLTDAGIWEDDGDQWVEGPDNRFGDPSDRPGLVKVIITLTDASEVARVVTERPCLCHKDLIGSVAGCPRHNPDRFDPQCCPEAENHHLLRGSCTWCEWQPTPSPKDIPHA